jgi:hypothetical protein
MDNAGDLIIGEVLTLKDLTSIVTDLESFMRTDTSDQGKSQAQLLGEWLNSPLDKII